MPHCIDVKTIECVSLFIIRKVVYDSTGITAGSLATGRVCGGGVVLDFLLGGERVGYV